MILSADYHTHSVFSHGKGTILENAITAKEKGLKEIAITDHGFSHPVFGMKRKKLPVMQERCKEVTEQTGVKVLLGIESNIVGIDGDIDVKKDCYDKFDMIVAGLHQFVWYKPRTYFTVFLPNFFQTITRIKKPSNFLIKQNTKTYINVIKNNPVDIISHINYGSFSDPVEVAKVAADYGTYIEINSKKVHLSDEQWYQVAKTGVQFVIDSDAHTANRVGEWSLVQELLKRVEIPESQIANINGKTAKLRFQEFKSRCGS